MRCSFNTYLIFLCLLILNTSCIKEDLSKISNGFDWKPSVSVPLAEMNLGTDDYNGQTSFLEYYNRNTEVLLTKYIDVDLSQMFLDDINHLKELTFRFYANNGFPARVEAYAYYQDVNSNIIGNVFNSMPVKIKAANANDNGDITRNFQFIHDEPVTHDPVDFLDRVERILLIVYFKELDPNPIVRNKIDNYNINISLGMRASLLVPVN